jgi:hypothetical protein
VPDRIIMEFVDLSEFPLRVKFPVLLKSPSISLVVGGMVLRKGWRPDAIMLGSGGRCDIPPRPLVPFQTFATSRPCSSANCSWRSCFTREKIAGGAFNCFCQSEYFHVRYHPLPALQSGNFSKLRVPDAACQVRQTTAKVFLRQFQHPPTLSYPLANLIVFSVV